MPNSHQTPEPTWLDRGLFPFTSRFLAIDNHHIHYIDEGSGPTLLFLHGNPTWSFLYRQLIQMCGDFRCLALDYPGFGLSQAASGYGFTPREHSHVVEQFIEQLDLTDITLFVHDWGGPIGLGVAGRQPPRFERFVIGNTFAWTVDDPLIKAFSLLLGSPVGTFCCRRFNACVNLLIPIGTSQPHQDLMPMYRGPFPTPSSREPTSIFAKEILGSREFLTEVYQGLSALADRRSLIVWGERDPAFRKSERQKFERIFPNHHTVLLEGAGHFIQEDAPEQIVKAFRQWLSST